MKKILFVEDDKFLRDIYKQKLEEAGFVVETLSEVTGDIVGIVSKIKPDLISMDLILPRRTGFEAVKLLKENEPTKNIPIFFLSNLEQKEDIKTGLSLGAVDYLVSSKMTPSEVVEIFSSYFK